MLYLRSKGLTELALADLGYADTISFRPGFLAGAERPKPRMTETFYGCTTFPLRMLYQKLINRHRFLTGIASHISDSVQIPVTTLAKSIRIAGQVGSGALPAAAKATKEGNDTPFTVIDNKGIIALAKTEV